MWILCYAKLYNPNISSTRENPIIYENIYPENIVDTGENETIEMFEIIRILHNKDICSQQGNNSDRKLENDITAGS